MVISTMLFMSLIQVTLAIYTYVSKTVLIKLTAYPLDHTVVWFEGNNLQRCVDRYNKNAIPKSDSN